MPDQIGLRRSRPCRARSRRISTQLSHGRLRPAARWRRPMIDAAHGRPHHRQRQWRHVRPRLPARHPASCPSVQQGSLASVVKGPRGRPCPVRERGGGESTVRVGTVSRLGSVEGPCRACMLRAGQAARARRLAARPIVKRPAPVTPNSRFTGQCGATPADDGARDAPFKPSSCFTGHGGGTAAAVPVGSATEKPSSCR